MSESSSSVSTALRQMSPDRSRIIATQCSRISFLAIVSHRSRSCRALCEYQATHSALLSLQAPQSTYINQELVQIYEKKYLRCLDLLSHIAGLIHSNLTVIAPLRGGAGLARQAISTIVPAHFGDVIVLSRRTISTFDLSVERR